MEWAGWKAEVGSKKSGETRLLPGLPEGMRFSYLDLKRSSDGGGGGGGGPPKPGDKPPWVDAVEGSVALLFNTSDDLERPFLTYMADQMAICLLGEWLHYCRRNFGHPSVHLFVIGMFDHINMKRNSLKMRSSSGWLDSKPRGSVLWVAFASKVSPTMDEYAPLAEALEESARPFIWVIHSK